MWSANNLVFGVKFSDKLLISIENNSGPRTEPWGTPASTFNCIHRKAKTRENDYKKTKNTRSARNQKVKSDKK